jgi:hypothetical protein
MGLFVFFDDSSTLGGHEAGRRRGIFQRGVEIVFERIREAIPGT